MAKAKKDISKDFTIKNRSEGETTLGIEVKEIPLNVSEITIIEIMHQKNISREAAILFIRNNQRK